MATYGSNDLRVGVKIILNGDPYTVVESDFVKPGKGQAFTRARVRNLKTGRTIEQTFKSTETHEGADVEDRDMEYLYSDGENWTFMDSSNFEQLDAGATAMADAVKWLKGNEKCIVTLWNGVPLQVTPPNFVELKITQTDPGLRGDTATGGTKPATLETNATVKVPLYMEEGEILKIDTRTGEYVSRVKA
ncbi:elongation factor P [Thiothrix lacustris]|jgi:elongation factor P|uniref:Elongation factor P n=1 Tax=Thiothrix lacustris TaxID=525917 RepID=A0ABY9MR30_9GAMM|nr:elongation factor P [Thiothrix lacustris]WML90630.1 elongation factor P [Thiothrix lacustris]WMP17704.1 elongation factor P [Thiothrix lacustris]